MTTDLQQCLQRTVKALKRQASEEPSGLDRMRLSHLADVLTAEVRVQSQRTALRP